VSEDMEGIEVMEGMEEIEGIDVLEDWGLGSMGLGLVFSHCEWTFNVISNEVICFNL